MSKQNNVATDKLRGREGVSSIDIAGNTDWMEAEFESFATQLEETIPGIAILGICRTSIPCSTAVISIQVSDDRRLGLVEEFVLESIMHSDELQSIDAISELLGLDRLFVKQSVDALGIAGAIEVVEGVKLTPTERTADILRLKELPSGIETIKIVATWNPIEQMAHHSEESIFMVEPNGVALFALGDVLPKVNWEDVSVIDPLLDHEHRLGKKIEITDVENSQARWLSLTLALYYDFVDHLTRFMLFQKTHLLRGLSHTLRDAQANGTWNIGDIFKGGRNRLMSRRIQESERWLRVPFESKGTHQRRLRRKLR